METLQRIQASHEINAVVAADAKGAEGMLANNVGAPGNILYPKMRQLKEARARLANEKHYLQQQHALQR